MSKLSREIVGRCAMGVMGLALLWGGVKCFRVGWAIRADLAEHRGRAYDIDQAKGMGLPIGVGVVLVLLGAPLAVAAVVPVDVFAKLMGRTKNTTLWDNSQGSDSLSRWGDMF
jgi:hypothetical protein